MCMKVNEGEWREMNVYELMQISIGQRVTALRLGAIPVFNAMSLPPSLPLLRKKRRRDPGNKDAMYTIA